MIPYTIVISCKNQPAHLQSALAALAAQSGSLHRFEAVVVDSSSDAPRANPFQDLSVPFPLRHLVSRNRPSVIRDVRNRAIRHARGLHVAFCTDEFVARPHFLQTLQDCHARSPEAVLCSAHCLVVPKHLLRRARGFDDALHGSPLSAWELVYRLQKAGCTLLPIQELIGDLAEQTEAPANSDVRVRHLRTAYHKHGYEDLPLLQMAVIPPWRDFEGYFETLHSYFEFSNGTAAQQTAARALRRACKLAAKLYDG